jgi:hypothetical protein
MPNIARSKGKIRFIAKAAQIMKTNLIGTMRLS